MSVAKPKVEKFLKESKDLLRDTPEAVLDDFLEVLKRENARQIKEQLVADLASLLARLSHIEKQQEQIIELLKRQLNLDVYEKEIMDLLKAKLEKE